MAKYDITFSCGHAERRDIIGKVKDRESKAQWMAEGLCSECWEAEKKRKFEEENKKAAEEAKEYGLPDLTGSEKQVAWATTIRQEWIAEAEKQIARIEERLANNPEPEKANRAIRGIRAAVDDRLLKNVDARSWIDSRGESVLDFVMKAGDKALREPEATPVEVPAEVKQEALEEMVIRPSEPITALVAEIRIKDNLVSANFPEINEGFRPLVRGLNFTWQKIRWERKTNIKTGSALDRATELGVKLLAAGFPIRVYDDELHTKILAGDYEPEYTRWIMKNVDAGKFSVQWNRNDADFYEASKTLPGAKWKSGSGMLVPKEAFRELQDFANQYGFKLSLGAEKMMLEAQEEFESAMVADVVVPEKDQLPQPGQRPKLKAEDAGGIDEDLLDS